MGINVDDVLDLETTLCSEFCINPHTLFIPQISQNGPFRVTPGGQAIRHRESYAGAPIFLPDGRLFGALCAGLTGHAVRPEPAGNLSLFARLIGCIFYANHWPRRITDTRPARSVAMLALGRHTNNRLPSLGELRRTLYPTLNAALDTSWCSFSISSTTCLASFKRSHFWYYSGLIAVSCRK